MISMPFSRISPLTGEVSTFGDLPEGNWKWHGGCVGPDGAIYGIPSHAESAGGSGS